MKSKLDLFDNIVLKIIVIIFSFIIPMNIVESINWKYNNSMLWVSGFISCLICNLIDIISSFGGYMESKYDYNRVIFECNYFMISEEIVEGRKTPILHIHSNEGYYLGDIKWYGAWRKFCFYPNQDTVWDNKCLSELLNFLEQYNKEWRNKDAKNSKKDIS